MNKKIVHVLIVFSIIAIMMGLYYKQNFSVLKTRNGMDVAQISRNISEGKGFVTRWVRPLNIAVMDIQAIDVPEVNHGLAYPYIVSFLFKYRGASDQGIAQISMLFLFLTCIAVYFLGSILFDHKAGLLAALVIGVSEPILSSAISGSEWTFCTLLFTLMLICIGLFHKKVLEEKNALQYIYCILTGLTASSLYYCHNVFAVLFIPLFVFFAITGRKKAINAVIFSLVFLVFASPVFVRNYNYTKSPLLGINSWDIMADTKSFPKDTIYRITDEKHISLSAALLFPVNDFGSFSEKFMRKSSDMIKNFFPMIGFFILPMAIVSMLYKFKSPSANVLRAITYGALPVLVITYAIYSVDTGSMMVFVPLAAVIGSAYFYLLLESKKLHPVYVRMLVGGVAVFTAFGSFATFTAQKFIDYTPQDEVVNKYFANLGQKGFEGIMYTDNPWTASWRTLAAAVWVPVNDSDVSDMNLHGVQMNVIVLTPESGKFSSNEFWYQLYEVELWQEYIKDPAKGFEDFIKYRRVPDELKPLLKKYLKWTKRTYPLSDSLTGLALQPPDIMQPKYVQVYLGN